MSIKLNQIYNEDCLKGMPNLPQNSIGIILTSPPYNTGRKVGSRYDVRYDTYQEEKDNQQYIEWSIELFKQFDRILKSNGCVLYNINYGNENAELLWLTIADIIKNTNFTIADTIIWKKNCALPNNASHNKLTRICEYVFVFCRKNEYMTFKTNKKVVSLSTTGQKCYENLYNFVEAKNNDESQDLNKATFSTDFVNKLLNIYGQKFDVVLDPFMGTGTTAIGAIDHNMYFIGYEISEKQCKYAENRIANRISKITLFDEVDYSADKFIED